jgi:transposase
VRTRGSPKLLEYRRLLAAQWLLDGDPVEEVANFLGIDARSVRRWRSRFRLGGWGSLLARPVSGRPPRLTSTQEKIVWRWLRGSATEHGFTTELWTGPRLARVISEEFGVPFHPDYLGSGCGGEASARKSPNGSLRSVAPSRLPPGWSATGPASKKSHSSERRLRPDG